MLILLSRVAYVKKNAHTQHIADVIHMSAAGRIPLLDVADSNRIAFYIPR